MPPRVLLSERTFHHFHHQAAATHWGAEDELVGPAILSRLGQRAEVHDDAQVERNCVFNERTL